MRNTIIKNWIKKKKDSLEDLKKQIKTFKENKRLYIQMGQYMRKEYDYKRAKKQEEKRRLKNEQKRS